MSAIFDPEKLQEICRSSLALPLEQKLDTVIAGIDKGVAMKPSSWMVEYARGFIAQAMPMGILASSLITMDFRSVRHQFIDYTKICVREMLRSHFV
jgi:hypothetical protein